MKPNTDKMVYACDKNKQTRMMAIQNPIPNDIFKFLIPDVGNKCKLLMNTFSFLLYLFNIHTAVV